MFAFFEAHQLNCVMSALLQNLCEWRFGRMNLIPMHPVRTNAGTLFETISTSVFLHWKPLYDVRPARWACGSTLIACDKMYFGRLTISSSEIWQECQFSVLSCDPSRFAILGRYFRILKREGSHDKTENLHSCHNSDDEIVRGPNRICHVQSLWRSHRPSALTEHREIPQCAECLQRKTSLLPTTTPSTIFDPNVSL
jgi:hypothetical protein